MLNEILYVWLESYEPEIGKYEKGKKIRKSQCMFRRPLKAQSSMTVVRLRCMAFKKVLQESTGSSSMGRRGKIQRTGRACDI
jgi:hypothetical protein